MATHDYIISNQTFPSTRSDINAVLSAIVSNNSSATEPSTTYAYMWWYDTTTTTLKFRNRDNDAWVGFASFDMDNDTVNFLDSTVTITGLATTATGTVFTLSDTDNKSSVDFIIDNEKKLVLREASGNGTNYVALKAPTTLASDVTFTLPSADGTVDQVLKTDGSGNLSFTDVSGGISWQSVQTTGFTAVKGNAYPCNTTSAGFTVTLPATPSAGDQVQIVDYAGTFDTNALVIDPNGEDIEGGASNLALTGEREGVILTYIDSTQGWIATSGINEGTDALSTAPYSVDFLVVAGGAGGGHCANIRGGGGGGAGGYRNSYSTETSGGGGSSEASLAFIPATVYTVTVGAGGASLTNGVDSSISGTGLTTITSIGGGTGGFSSTSANSGGSGGGRGHSSASLAGSGTANQGFAGGAINIDNNPPYIGTGGGGAGGVGGNASVSPNTAGAGGVGLASSITGSSVDRGGGGGGAGLPSPVSGGTASFGGGAGNGGGTATAGTANTGGGGGAGNSAGASGGSGVVILRMADGNYSGTTTGSPTVTTGVGGTDTVLVFNSSGSYTA